MLLSSAAGNGTSELVTAGEQESATAADGEANYHADDDVQQESATTRIMASPKASDACDDNKGTRR